ncbi:MAG: EamA family transporter RarD [Actinobacteria bacterium]|uniref:Unannotated protein n=1 Tax=freshwater metagenome TaxID=449393 RepID=A0A6J7AK54_9ZZZZ|nr:EamA family transporter RarD [Actinomycetota bacterium]
MFPLYFALLDSVSPFEIVAHRVIWSLVFLCAIITARRGWPKMRQTLSDRRSVGLLLIASLALSINWLVYIYVISIGELVQASLGYFINPLVSVALGVILLGERLRKVQWFAVGLAVIAVLVLAFSYGAIPWSSLILAFTFAFYGLIKKFVGFGAVESLTVETAVLSPVAIIFLVTLESSLAAAFIEGGIGISLMLLLLGPITAIPLLAFGAAAKRLPLSTMGLLQYITPIILFIFGLTIFHDSMSTSRWIGFIIVWVALIVFSVDAVRQAKKAGNDRRSVLAQSLEVTEPD